MNNVLTFLYPVMHMQRIKVINEVPLGNETTHSGWHRDIDDDTYVLSTFREPFSHVLSLYFYMCVAQKEPQYFPDRLKYIESELDKEKFLNKLFVSPYYGYILSNHQIKNFLYNHGVINGKFDPYLDPELRIEDVLEKAKRVNFMMRMDELPQNPLLIAEKIINDMELDITIEEVAEKYRIRKPYLDQVNPLTITPQTQQFANDFTLEERNMLWTRIRGDYHIYSMDSLYHKFNEENK